MFNRAVNAFRKGIHRKSSQSVSQDDDLLYASTFEDEDEMRSERLSIRPTTSCSFRSLENTQCASSSVSLGAALQSSEGIQSFVFGWLSYVFFFVVIPINQNWKCLQINFANSYITLCESSNIIALH